MSFGPHHGLIATQLTRELATGAHPHAPVIPAGDRPPLATRLLALVRGSLPRRRPGAARLAVRATYVCQDEI
ncbi:hypothetical protein K1W54_20875 [Micromonospora sp. CPCC 205371]|nr:hypothetical protein [Micromonospora sp. CPCC 205371]